MGGRKDLITAGLTLGALADSAAKAKGKMSAIIATESGAVVSFTAADDAPVVDLTAAIVPVQSGSGDPSPSNIRPISGWTGCKVYRSGADTSDPTIYTVSFGSAGTVYGGTPDVTTGTLTVTKASVDLGTLTWTAVSASSDRAYAIKSDMEQTGGIEKKDIISSEYASGLWNADGCQISHYNSVIRIQNPQYYGYTGAQWKTALSGVQAVYPLGTPIVYNLTPVEIRTLAGQNTIWADTGDVTVKYATTDTKAFIDKYIAARRNG